MSFFANKNLIFWWLVKAEAWKGRSWRLILEKLRACFPSSRRPAKIVDNLARLHPTTNCSPTNVSSIERVIFFGLLVRIDFDMSLAISRSVLRQSTKLPGRSARRFESTTGKATEATKDTASKASQTASEYKSKASEGLSRVTSTAGPAISGAVKGLGNSLGKIGGRTGKLIAFIEREWHLKDIN